MLQVDHRSVVQRERGRVELRWRPKRPGLAVSICAGPSPQAIDFAEPLLTTRANEACLANLDPRTRHYFGLVPEDGEPVVLGERRLPLDGAPNFRDLGGYGALGGRRVRWGVLYRSGHLADLSGTDRRYLEALELRLVCDLRGDAERLESPSRFPPGLDAEVRKLEIRPGSADRFRERLREGDISRESMREFMAEMNRELVDEHASDFARVFEAILEAAPGAVLLHCAAGKDRTGLAVALVLLALGVPRETVMRDYLLTGEYFPTDQVLADMQRRYEERGAARVDPDALRPVFDVHADYLGAALEAIDRRHRSFEVFVREALGLSDEARRELRARFLE